MIKNIMLKCLAVKIMLKKVKAFINKYNLIEDDKTIICAVSGGKDSVSLIHILYSLGYKVVLAHVNHNMREQSKIEQVEMKKLADKLNVPFELLDYHYQNDGNFQARAHDERYKFFMELCDKYNTNIIATAHHADDQIETVLLQIMEGSNLFGYGGISPFHNVNGYRIIRPLLIVSKDDIIEYVKDNNLITFEDESNYTDHYLRNKIRHHITPLLKEYCPTMTKKISIYSIQAKEAFSFIRNLSINYLKKWNNIIDINEFNNLDIALRKDIISLLLENNDINHNYQIIESIIKLFNATNGTKLVKLSDGYMIVRNYDKAYLKKKEASNSSKVHLDLNSKVNFLNFSFYFSKNMPQNNAKFIKLCYNTLELPLVIRTRANSDTIKLDCGTKKASRVLIDCKVPKDRRDEIPFIFNGNNELLWIYDYKKSKLVSDNKNKADLFLICEVNDNGQ